MTTRKELRMSFDSGTPPAHAARVLAASLRRGYQEWADRSEAILKWCLLNTDPEMRDLIVLVQEPDSMLPYDAVACLLPSVAGPHAAARIAQASVEARAELDRETAIDVNYRDKSERDTD